MPTSPPYRPRTIDEELKRLLAAMGAVLVEGPKACGKTETARQVAAREVRLDVDRNVRDAPARRGGQNRRRALALSRKVRYGFDTWF